jgi:tetratricopeptide (TPR) repeat protein
MTNASHFQDSPIMAFDVFISYSTRNKLIADAMKQYLQSKGIRCWKAPDDIVHGESWAAAIPRAIKSSQIMVLIWTIDSMNSRQVVNELTLADRAMKMIIPFRAEDIQPENEFEYYLAKTHWLDAFGPKNDEGFELLSERVLRNLDERARPSANDEIDADVASIDPVKVLKVPLQGDKLLAKVKELGDASKSDLVRSCGYVSTIEGGSERLDFNGFYEALLKAKGLEVPGAQPEEAEVLDLHEGAIAKIENGDYNAAIEMLDKAISISSKASLLNTEIYYDRAVALSNLSRGQEALADLTLAIEMSEEPEALYYRLRGIVHEELGALSLACADWRIAAELGEPDSSEWFDAQCSCPQDSAESNEPIDGFSIVSDETAEMPHSWQESPHGELAPQGECAIATRESDCKPSLESIEKQIAVILEEAEAMTSETVIKTRSYYLLNPDKSARLLSNHSLNNESDSIYLFFNAGLIRAKNGLLITDRRVSIKDFWEKPVHFSYCDSGEGLLMALIGVSSEKVSVGIYKDFGESGSSLVREVNLDLHNLANESFFDKDFLVRRVPELIELLGKRQMIASRSSWL